MRALGHPARMAIIEHLGSSGREITATEAAELVGLSPSATSYHLRELAKVGLIQDAPSRGDNRERVYRGPASGHLTISVDHDSDEETREAAERVMDVFLARSEERLRQWRRTASELPRQWSDASTMNEAMLIMTPEELLDLTERVMALMDPYRRGAREGNAPDGSREVAFLIRALPQEGPS
ncbi:MAG: winged helix-turn-helix transcriptional regulator [Hamadaea sp.]|nr:winged helix-turn-helix transcriptional regulator [Hamadaea sp.]